MSKLVFDYSESEKSVIPYIENASSSLLKVFEKINSMDIPDFNKISILMTIKNNSLNQKKDLEHLISWIRSSNSSLEHLIDDYINIIKYLPNYKIEKRDSIIKS